MGIRLFKQVAKNSISLLLTVPALCYNLGGASAEEARIVQVELNGTNFQIPKEYVGFITTEKASVGDRAGASLHAMLPDLRALNAEENSRYSRQQISISIEHPISHTAAEDIVGWVNISKWSHVGSGQKAEKWGSGELIKGDKETANTKTWLWDMYRLSSPEYKDQVVIFCSQVRPTASNTTCGDAFLYKSLIVKIFYSSQHLEQWADIRRNVRGKLDLWSGSDLERK